MSDSLRPHKQQPTRLPCPWDSPGKNTGVGCHFLLQSMKVKSESEVAQSCSTLRDPIDCSPPGSSIHGTFQARVLEWGAIAFSNYFCYCLPFTLKFLCTCLGEQVRISRRGIYIWNSDLLVDRDVNLTHFNTQHLTKCHLAKTAKWNHWNSLLKSLFYLIQ